MPLQVINAIEVALAKLQQRYTSSIQARPSKAVPPLMDLAALRPEKVCLRAVHLAVLQMPGVGMSIACKHHVSARLVFA